MRTFLLHLIYIQANIVAGAAMWHYRERIAAASARVAQRLRRIAESDDGWIK